MLLTDFRETASNKTTVDHGAGNLVCGDIEAGMDQELEVGGICVGEPDQADLVFFLKSTQMVHVMEKSLIAVVPAVVCIDLALSREDR